MDCLYIFSALKRWKRHTKNETSMIRQEEAFLRACGNEWYKNNKDKLGQEDPVSEMLDTFGPDYKPHFVVELGCANGWRLQKLKERYGCRTLGLDPSESAVAARIENVTIGTADNLRNVDS